MCAQARPNHADHIFRSVIQRLILKKLDRVEAELGGSMDYLRHMVRVSRRAFFKFAKIMLMAEYRRVAPVDAYFVASIVASRDEDCGTCVQIGVNMARKSGVPREVLKAVFERRPENLLGNLGDVYRFTQAVVQAAPEADVYREEVRIAYGDEVLVEQAPAMASARLFPVTKRALGYAKSCALVEVRV